MTRLIAAIVLALCASCCAPAYDPGPSPVDAGTLDDCERACARLAELGCPEAEPTPEGATCVDVCWNAESSGVVTLDPVCVAAINSCDELGACLYVPEL